MLLPIVVAQNSTGKLLSYPIMVQTKIVPRRCSHIFFEQMETDLLSFRLTAFLILILKFWLT